MTNHPNEPQAFAANAEAHPGDQYEIPAYEKQDDSFAALKGRIKKHYEIASDYYYSLWGQHIHHGYFKSPTETKEEAQVNLIRYLLEISDLPRETAVLDVGCGLGGTSRYLAREHACRVTGITISGRQVEIARRLTQAEASSSSTDENVASEGGIAFPSGGRCDFVELDAETMVQHFPAARFGCVWISEALSHLPNKQLFFASAFALLAPGRASRLVIADWFRAPDLTPEQAAAEIQPIEDGMLLPPLCTADQYVEMARGAGFTVHRGPIDISKDVAKTWCVLGGYFLDLGLLAVAQGRDGLAFLQAFRAMRRGYANGSFRYAIMCFAKP
ncbi:tocopherol O-methyltransferase [Xylariaceae sp. FL0662B]|nr:tocopherol O-methyltransferase [Xylariaceae sp. FL0662B]